MSLIFVYGTLKKGYHNHRRIADAKFVGKFCTAPKYKIYCNGLFPYMIESSDGIAVEGEVYEVTPAQIKSMDQLEGHPTFYKRSLIDVPGLKDVSGYIYQGDPTGCRDCGAVWSK